LWRRKKAAANEKNTLEGMPMTTMNQLFDSTMFFGGNAPFVEELYENYLNDPTSVDAEWRDYFDRLAQMPGYVARDVAHAPVIAAFAELAKDGGVVGN
jgi:2-oxoglutarate dehydrogenase E1 component